LKPELVWLNLGSGYRTDRGFLNLNPYSNTYCNVMIIHEENAVGLVEA